MVCEELKPNKMQKEAITLDMQLFQDAIKLAIPTYTNNYLNIFFSIVCAQILSMFSILSQNKTNQSRISEFNLRI